MLNKVGHIGSFEYYRDVCQLRGQFTGANGSVGTIQFKGMATITRTGEGTYVLKVLAADGVSALKGMHVKNFNIWAINPNTADGLSGPTLVTADAMSTAGTLNFTTQNAALAAADIIAIAKMAIELSPEAPS
jgi:hypothetical protein